MGDAQCNSDIEAWAPFYPNAETVSVQYDMFRARGLGNTVWIQSSTDDEETVRQFYRDNIIKLFKAERNQGLASTHWDTKVDAETGRTQIILASSCGI